MENKNLITNVSKNVGVLNFIGYFHTNITLTH